MCKGHLTPAVRPSCDRSHYAVDSTDPRLAASYSGIYGVLKLTLRRGSYDFRFVPEAGQTYSDSGSRNCHEAP